MSRKQKKLLFRIIAAFILTAAVYFIPLRGVWKLGLYLISYLVIGYDVLINAFYGIIRGRVLDENFLMAVATVGAFIIGFMRTGDYIEAVAVMLFYQTGEWFQRLAVDKSRKSIASLMDMRPEQANIEQDGKIVAVSPEEVPIGSITVVLSGEKVAIDGIVVEGTSSLDTSALTGESIPIDVSVGSEVLSGSINEGGLIKVKTTKLFANSTVSKILDLIENASSNKSKSENFISKFARFYTPIVCALALALGVLPPIISMLL